MHHACMLTPSKSIMLSLELAYTIKPQHMAHCELLKMAEVDPSVAPAPVAAAALHCLGPLPLHLCHSCGAWGSGACPQQPSSPLHPSLPQHPCLAGLPAGLLAALLGPWTCWAHLLAAASAQVQPAARGAAAAALRWPWHSSTQSCVHAASPGFSRCWEAVAQDSVTVDVCMHDNFFDCQPCAPQHFQREGFFNLRCFCTSTH